MSVWARSSQSKADESPRQTPDHYFFFRWQSTKKTVPWPRRPNCPTIPSRPQGPPRATKNNSSGFTRGCPNAYHDVNGRLKEESKWWVWIFLRPLLAVFFFLKLFVFFADGFCCRLQFPQFQTSLFQEPSPRLFPVETVAVEEQVSPPFRSDFYLLPRWVSIPCTVFYFWVSVVFVAQNDSGGGATPRVQGCAWSPSRVESFSFGSCRWA